MNMYARWRRVYHECRLTLLTLLVGYLVRPSSPFSHQRLGIGTHNVHIDHPMWALKVNGGVLLVSRQPMPFAVRVPHGV